MSHEAQFVDVAPACIEKWLGRRSCGLPVAEMLHVKDEAKAKARQATCRSRSSVRARSSLKPTGGGRQSSAREPQQGGAGAVDLVEAAYAQLCKEHGVKQNTGLINCLRALPDDDAAALKVLDLNDNYVGASGLRIVVDLLGCSSRLRVLGLAQQGIDAKALNAMLPAISAHTALRVVDLSHNPLAVTAARLLADLARNTETLEEVRLRGTRIVAQWDDRIRSRLADVRQRRIAGVDATPVYRTLRYRTYVNCLVYATDADLFDKELAQLDTVVFPRLNTTLEARGVTLIPIFAHPKTSAEVLVRFVDECADQLNHGLPWVVLLAGPTDATSAPASPGATRFESVCAHVGRQLDALEPQPAVVDKNGRWRRALRAQVPAVQVVTGSLDRGRAPCLPACLRALAAHRLVTFGAAPAAGFPHVFNAAMASRMLHCLDTVYPAASVTDDAMLAATSASLHYPPRNLPVHVLHGALPDPPSAPEDPTASEPPVQPAVEEPPNPAVDEEFYQKQHAVLHRQWCAAAGLLGEHCARRLVEDELLGYCRRYEPEGDWTYPLILYGRDGLGKSATLAWLARELRTTGGGAGEETEGEAQRPARVPHREAKKPLVVLPVFLGHGPEGRDVWSVVEAFVPVLREALGVEREALAAAATRRGGRDALLKEWHELLSAPCDSPRKVVVLLVGVTQVLCGDGLLLVPTTLNVHTRVVASIMTPSPDLNEVRARVPRPYELLLTDLTRPQCIAYLQHHLHPTTIPGLDPSAPLATQSDEGVLTRPSNAADAIVFKQCGVCPLYLRLLVLILKAEAGSLGGEGEVLSFVDGLPETILEVFGYLLGRLEARFGVDLVTAAFVAIALHPTGFRQETILTVLRTECVYNNTAGPAQEGPVGWLDTFWIDSVVPLLSSTDDGLSFLLHPCLRAAVEVRYVTPALPVEKYHGALAKRCFRVLLHPFSSAYKQRLALEALPDHLLGAGRVLDALLLVTDPTYIERELQAGLSYESPCAAFKARYVTPALPVEKYHGALPKRCFRVLLHPFLSAYKQQLALEALLLVTDPTYIERELQAGLSYELVAATARVEASVAKCGELFVEGFESNQFKPVREVHALRAVRALLADQRKYLDRHPSVLQACANLPRRNPLHVAFRCHVAAPRGVPHPLLQWRNQAPRACLASRTVRFDEPVVHVAFSRPADGGSILFAATTSGAVYICEGSAVTSRLSLADSVEAPPDGFLASHFTNDGLSLVTAAATQLVVWRVGAEDGALLHNILDVSPSITRPLSFDSVTCVAVQLASGKGAVIDTRKGRVISTLRPHVDEEPIRNIFYTSSSNTVVSVGLNTICVYVESEQAVVRGHQACFFSHCVAGWLVRVTFRDETNLDEFNKVDI
ncbi:Vegetative incompatibility protein HET-E-1 [Diplonema papillatum]|nr:Vegetative incompatibility protein HET-E-1 [Diplonema papillatum]